MWTSRCSLFFLCRNKHHPFPLSRALSLFINVSGNIKFRCLHCQLLLFLYMFHHQYLKGAYEKDEDKPFRRPCCNRTRGTVFKPREDRFRLDTRKKFFAQSGTRCPISENIQDRLARAPSNLVLLRDVGDVPAHCKVF